MSALLCCPSGAGGTGKGGTASSTVPFERFFARSRERLAIRKRPLPSAVELLVRLRECSVGCCGAVDCRTGAREDVEERDGPSDGALDEGVFPEDENVDERLVENCDRTEGKRRSELASEPDVEVAMVLGVLLANEPLEEDAVAGGWLLWLREAGCSEVGTSFRRTVSTSLIEGRAAGSITQHRSNRVQSASVSVGVVRSDGRFGSVPLTTTTATLVSLGYSE